MKTKFLILILLSVCSLQDNFAQGGFLNKKNQIQFDFFNPLFSGDYGFTLTRSIKEDMALSVGFKFNRNSTPQLRAYHDYGDEFYAVYLAFVSKDLREHIPIWGSSKGLLFEFDILASGLSGMQLPLGHYWGYGYEIFLGSFEQSELIGDIMYITPFDHRSHKLKGFWGKNTYLKSNFTLDMRLEFGLQFGKSSSLSSENIVAHFPYYRGVFNMNFIRISDSTIEGVYFERYLGTFIYPKLSIGYLF
ncbi:MAG: hypothetical protein HOD63_10700 [Bacteroidetes bacterium]|jgi:hypothetical protein|nr:hypothetical protein [Bacteroidota bacterium]MBT5528266.1 hypothetical protein [Cytophagia bacterium]MBT3801373.1 hypothetical protein [Bacteroidota bacterium]MBT3934789.1 hypothetical protein [Bacteroidota bacterium]MBT4339051.1 hypothetical protein [Bacteroidota bacterium]